VHWICTELSVVPFARRYCVSDLLVLDLTSVSAYRTAERLRWSIWD